MSLLRSIQKWLAKMGYTALFMIFMIVLFPLSIFISEVIHCYSGSDKDFKICSAVKEDLYHIALKTGVIYRNERQYLHSAFSVPLRTIAPKCTMAFQIDGPRPDDSSYSWRGRMAYDNNHSYYSLSHELNVSKTDITIIILGSLTSSYSWWYQMLNEAKVRTVDPNYGRIRTSLIGFQYPATGRQLDEYRRWLISAIGSEDLLIDGWRHPIKLSLEEKYSPPVLVAHSAGPDGKWDTKDDMMLRRNTKTGEILEEIGFAGSNSKPGK